MGTLYYGSPVQNPAVPFVFDIPGALPDYGMFILEGFVPMDSQGFAINLQLGTSVNPRDDVALHLGFLFNPSPRLTVNTIQRNQWGTPSDHTSCPIRKMDPFQIHILVQRRCFMIALNNQHFCEFAHRMDPSLIRAIAADGSVVINFLQLEFPGGVENTNPQAGRPVSPLLNGSYNPFPPMPPPNVAPPVYATSSTPIYNRGPAPSQPVTAQQQPASSGFPGKNLLTSGAALGALSGLAAMAAPLFYPGMKKKKMKHKGYKQRGMFGGGGGLPFLGGGMGTGGCETGHGMGGGGGGGLGSILGGVGSMLAARQGMGHGYGHRHGGHYGGGGGGGGGMLPGLGMGAAAAGLGGAGLGYMMGGHRGHHGGHHGGGWGGGGGGGYSSSSSYSSDSD